MIEFTDRAITPKKQVYDRALRRFPEAERRARDEAMSLLHQRVQAEVQRAGLDASPVVVAQGPVHPYLGIAAGPAGDALADVEFGRPEQESAPRPVLRDAARRYRREAESVFSETLQRELGL